MWGKVPNPKTHTWFYYLVKHQLSLHLQTSPGFPRSPPPCVFKVGRAQTHLIPACKNTPGGLRLFAALCHTLPSEEPLGGTDRGEGTRRLLRYLACVTVWRLGPHLDCRRLFAATQRSAQRTVKFCWFSYERREEYILKPFSKRASPLWHTVAWWSDGDTGGCVFGILPLLTQSRCKRRILVQIWLKRYSLNQNEFVFYFEKY